MKILLQVNLDNILGICITKLKVTVKEIIIRIQLKRIYRLICDMSAQYSCLELKSVLSNFYRILYNEFNATIVC